MIPCENPDKLFLFGTRIIFLPDAKNRTIVFSFVWTKHRNVIYRETEERTESLWLLQLFALRAMRKRCKIVRNNKRSYQSWRLVILNEANIGKLTRNLRPLFEVVKYFCHSNGLLGEHYRCLLLIGLYCRKLKEWTLRCRGHAAVVRGRCGWLAMTGSTRRTLRTASGLGLSAGRSGLARCRVGLCS